MTTTNNAELETKIKNIISEKLKVPVAEVTSEAKFTDDLKADSLDLVELMMEVEKETGISIPDEDAATLHSVTDIVSYIAKNKK